MFCVNHKILLSELQFFGISGKFYDLIVFYLSDRDQRVLIASADLSYIGISLWEVVREGVPQGSILGPHVFLFYIHDPLKIFNNSVKSVLLADDTTLVISSGNNVQYRNEVDSSFAHLNAWFNSNLLT
jgi:hypothetical protein